MPLNLSFEDKQVVVYVMLPKDDRTYIFSKKFKLFVSVCPSDHHNKQKRSKSLGYFRLNSEIYRKIWEILR